MMFHFGKNFLDFWKEAGMLIHFWLMFLVVYPQVFIAPIPFSFYLFALPAGLILAFAFRADNLTLHYLAGVILFLAVYIYYFFKSPESFLSFETWTVLLLIGIIVLFLAFLGANNERLDKAREKEKEIL